MDDNDYSQDQDAPVRDLRNGFEEQLGSWLTRYTGGSPAVLGEAVRYACAAGKRVRPLLCLAAAEACGGSLATAIAPAVSLELVHCYSLVHDDLPAMDNDTLRRGQPTVHVLFGEAQAILAGDALLTMAFNALADQRLGSLPTERRLALVGELALAAGGLGMVGGQADELSVAAASGIADARRVAAGKTGALLRAAVRMGGIAAGADRPALSALTEVGEQFGLAYQVVDDLGDVSKDRAAGRKLNYAMLLGTAGAAEFASQLCRNAGLAAASLGSNGTARSLKAMVSALEHSIAGANAG